MVRGMTRAGAGLRVRPLGVSRPRFASGAYLRPVRRSGHVPDVRGLPIGARIAGRRPPKALNCRRRFVNDLTERHCQPEVRAGTAWPRIGHDALSVYSLPYDAHSAPTMPPVSWPV